MDNGRDQKLPWDKWFWQDYMSDPAVRRSSLAAQGLWVRMWALWTKAKSADIYSMAITKWKAKH